MDLSKYSLRLHGNRALVECTDFSCDREFEEKFPLVSLELLCQVTRKPKIHKFLWEYRYERKVITGAYGGLISGLPTNITYRGDVDETRSLIYLPKRRVRLVAVRHYCSSKKSVVNISSSAIFKLRLRQAQYKSNKDDYSLLNCTLEESLKHDFISETPVIDIKSSRLARHHKRGDTDQ